MNPEPTPTPREQTEMRLTALLMGELSAEETVALHAQIAADPGLARLHARLRQAMALLREATAEPEPATPTPARLSTERRERLLAHFKNPAPQPAKPAPIVKAPRRNWSWVVPLGAAAAVVVILAGLLFPAVSTVKMSAKPRGFVAAPPEVEDSYAFRAASERKALAENAPQMSEPASFSGGMIAGVIDVKPTPDLPAVRVLNQSGNGTLALAPAEKSKATALFLPPTTDAPASGEPAAEARLARSVDGLKRGQWGLRPMGEADPTIVAKGQEIPIPEELALPEIRKLPDDAKDGRLAQNREDVEAWKADKGGFIYFPTPDAAATPSEPAPPVVGFDGFVNFGSPIAPPEKPALQSGKDARNRGDLAASQAGGDKQVEIKAKNVEITQNNLKELNAPGGGPVLWTDDESAKLNIDTRSEGTVWDEADGKRRPANKAEGEKVQQLARALDALEATDSREKKKEPAKPAEREADPFGDADDLRDAQPAPAPAPLAAKPPPPPSEPLPVVTAPAVAELKKEIAIQPRQPEELHKKIDEAVLLDRDEKNGRQAGKAVPQTAMGSEQAEDLAQRRLAEAQSFLETDRLDLAFKRAERVFSNDPDNQAARQIQEKVAKAKDDYAGVAYNEQRARSLQKVDKAWANPVRRLNVSPATEALPKMDEFAEKEITEQRSRVSALKQQEEVLAKLKPEELPQTLRSLALEDSSVARANRAVGELGAEEKRLLNSGLGGDHPSVKAVREKLARAQSESESTMKATRDKLADVSAQEAKKLAVMEQRLAHEQNKKAPDEETPPARPAQPAAIPQPEVATSANAFSTFSLNVSDVSFKLAGASLEKGRMPELATVRSEEFINAFDYRDPEPAAGAPLAFATERARYPFAQNRDLVRFSVKTAAAGRQPGRPLNLVLLLDNSGSMERADRVRILREALRVLAAQLQPQDRLSVMTFARKATLRINGVAGDKASEAITAVGEIPPEGGTNIAVALDEAYEIALRHYQPGSISRVVLLTDGAANLGDVNPDALKRKVETNRQRGVALDCFGIGWEGYDDTLLETLARNGDGRYGFINTPEEAASGFAAQLAGALRVAASDVKVQVEWNPRRVTAYRQIGYAKHQLKKEQFRDNTVDAAEIGAAESGNALYVVEVNPRGEGDLATVRVRFKVPGTADYKEHEWSVPFTKDAPSLEQASPALRLAGTASAFSEWLVASPYAAEVTTDRLLGLLNGVPAIYPADPRPKKLEWMIRTAKSVSGR
jgi:Mg-chelatase subunit ChlD